MSRLVTVIPVYNGERFLEATLESVASQTRRPDRVIIQDNCSTDGTHRIAKTFEKEGFEWRLTDEHVGSTENFNNALHYAEEADVLHLLTADDLIKPEFYERMLEPLEAVKGRALIYAAYEVIGEDGALVEGGDLMCPFPIVPGGAPIDIPQKEFIAAQADLRTICLPAVLMKTNRESMPVEFYTHFIQCADAVFYAELAAACEAVIEVPAALCQYRRHEHTTTSRNRREPGAVIADEWQAMVAASALLEKSGLSAWLWNFRQRCLLAARSRVKLRQSADETPHYRQEIEQATRALTGPWAAMLGNLAVALRGVSGQGRR
jgi:glycosyltransferase involved in cell wall biosynthesis